MVLGPLHPNKDARIDTNTTDHQCKAKTMIKISDVQLANFSLIFPPSPLSCPLFPKQEAC